MVQAVLMNRLGRRAFFQIIAGAIASSALLTCPAVADAIEQFGDGKTDQDRISRLLISARKTAVLGPNVPSFPTKSDLNLWFSVWRNSAESDALNAAFGKTLFILNTEFDPSEVSNEDLRGALRSLQSMTPEVYQLDEAAFRNLIEIQIPLAAVLVLMRNNQLPFNVLNIPEFGKFSHNYSRAIRPDSDPNPETYCRCG